MYVCTADGELTAALHQKHCGLISLAVHYTHLCFSVSHENNFYLLFCSHVNRRTQYENPVVQAKRQNQGK